MPRHPYDILNTSYPLIFCGRVKVLIPITSEKTFDIDDLMSHLSDFANLFLRSYNKESAIKSCIKIMSFVKKNKM